MSKTSYKHIVIALQHSILSSLESDSYRSRRNMLGLIAPAVLLATPNVAVAAESKKKEKNSSR